MIGHNADDSALRELDESRAPGTASAVEQAQKLPPVVDVPTAAAILGIGRTAAYELIRLGWDTT